MNVEYFHLVYFIILGISFLLSLTVYLRKNAPLYFKLFPPFLMLTLVVEYIGRVLTSKGIPNTPMYNFFIILEFIFYFSLMLQFVENKKIKKIIFYTIWIYPFLSLLNIFFFQGFTSWNTYTLNLGALLLIGFCGYYFYELIKQPGLSKPAREPGFWICCGLIFFYSVTFPLITVINLTPEYSLVDVDYIVLIQVTPNYILYGSFTIAFICYFKYRRLTLKTPFQPPSS